MTILLFGGGGQLGRDIQLALTDHDVVAVDVDDVDIRDRDAVSNLVTRHAPQAVINSAAMTNVDQCETDDVTAFEVNAMGARNVAAAAHAAGTRLLHISTDYVFDGANETPYVERDATLPINAYGLSKLAGEYFVRSVGGEFYIVRSSGLYGTHECVGKGGRNFVETMLALAAEGKKLRVVDDEILTPTYTVDLAAQIALILETAPEPGVYHATNAGQCSWFEFARAAFDIAGVDADLSPTSAAEWDAPAARPPYSVLANAALAERGVDRMPPWQDALQRYFEERSRK